MTAWDIEPSGVSGVVTRTKTTASHFDGQLKDIQKAMTDGASGSASKIVASAVSGFATHITPDISFVVTRTGNTLTAAVNATNAYIQGDLVMAAHAQQSATAAPDAGGMPRGGHQPR